jgi:hypothetical protein
MRERRHLGEKRRLDVLPGDEHVDVLEARFARRVDQVLPLGDEQTELLAPAALVQLADELELLVVARVDQVSC